MKYEKKAISKQNQGRKKKTTNSPAKQRFAEAQRIDDTDEPKGSLDVMRLTQFVVDNMPDTVYWLTSKGEMVYVNQATCQKLGYSQSELLKMQITDIVPAYSQTDWAKHFKMLKQQRSLVFESRQKKKNGEVFPVEVRTNLVQFEDEEYACTVVHDITERKRAEEDLRTTQNFLTVLMENAPMSIYATSAEGRLFLVNRAWETSRRLRREDAIGSRLGDLFSFEMARQLDQDNHRVIESAAPLVIEESIDDPDGRHYYHTVKFPLRGAGDRVESVGGISIDITERKRAEQALRENEEKWRSLVMTIPDFVAIHDQNGKYLFLNHYADGFSERNVIGRDVVDFIAPESRPLFKQRMEAVQKTGEMQQFEHKAVGANGEQREYEEFFTLLKGPGGEKNTLAVARDITDRKRVEERLLESEARYRFLVDELNEGLYITDINGVITFVNRALVRILGYENPDEIIGKNFIEFIPFDKDKGLLKQYRAAMLGKSSSKVIVTEIIRGDGEHGYLEIKPQVIFEEGKPVGDRGIIFDITERKQAEDRLRESEERYRDLVENSHELIYTHDLRGQLLSVNHTAALRLGYNPTSLVGRNLAEIQAPEERNKFDDYLDKVRRKGSLSGTWVLQNTTGERRIWEYHSTIRSETRQSPHVRGMAHDITERMRAEEALRESEERFRKIFEEGSFGMVLTSRDLKFFSANPAFCRMLGYTEDEMNTRTFLDVTHPEHREADKRNVEMLWRGEISHYKTEKRYIAKNGDIRWGSLSTSIILGLNGEPLYALAMVKDVTERKQTEEALERRNSELTALNQIGQALNRLAEPSEILELIFTVIGQVLDNRNLFIALYDQASQTISFPLYAINGEQIYGGDRPLGNGITDYVIRTNKPFLVKRNLEKVLTKRGIDLIGTLSRSFLAVPMRLGDKVIGVIALQDYDKEKAYDEQQLELLTTIAALATTALENARLYAAMQKELEERKQAEEGVRESEYRYRAVFEGVEDAIFIESSDGRILDANRRACDMFGYSHAEFLTKKVADLVPSEDYIVAFNPNDSPTLPIHPFETVNVRANGEQFPIELNIRMQTFNGEQVLFVVGRDVSERKRVQELLRESEARFKMMFEQAPLAINITRGTTIMYANPAYIKMFGYNSLEDLQDLSPLELFTPEFRSVILENIRRRAQELPVPNGYESECLRKDGTRFSVIMDFSRISFADGPATVGFILNITDRKRAEQALHDSEERFKQIAEQTEEWIWEVNARGLYTISSPIVEKILGYSPDELVGKKYFYDLFIPDQRENLKQAAFAAFARNESIKGFVNENVHKDGRIVILETNGIPIFDATGTLLGYRGADKDITERKRAEKELANSREQLRALSRYLQAAREEERTFIAREIHDELGQELTALKMDLAWLVKQLPQDQSLLVQKTGAMSEMVDDTIQTVRRVASQLRPGMLDDLGLVAALEWQAGEFQSRTGINCKLDLPENLTTLGKDQATAMFRIFQETLTNIGRHAHATKVVVVLKELPEGIDLIVRDNGVGITEDQLNDPRSLGLTGMRERLQAFGGMLQFKSLKGKGTSVRVRMPLANKQLEKET